MLNTDILTILRVYIISLGLGLISWPILKSLFKRLPDQGWSLTRIFTTLATALTIWELGNLDLPVNNTIFLFSATAVLLLINILIAWDQGKNFFHISKDLIKIVVIEEYLFLVGLFVVSLARGFMPNIDSLEKFMDFGFVNRYLSSATLPAMDMWQAGQIINYYSFGHFWASILIRYFNLVPAIGYNILLGFIAALTMQLSFAVVLSITSSKNLFASMTGGIVGAFAVAFAGNSHIIWYAISHRGLNAYWYADATRFIHNTIHEFPGYSFVVADLHGHLLDLPIVLAFILITSHWIYNKNFRDEILMGIIFGIMMMTNTWDVAVYGLLLVVCGLQMLLGDKRKFLPLLQSAGIMMLFMALTALPWWLTFKSISDGIRMVTTRSELWQLGVLWAGGLLATFICLTTEGMGDKKIVLRTMGISILLLILIPEFVYAKDIYPDHPRANTMFKLTYQASVMIGLLLGSAWGNLFDNERRLSKWWRWPAIAVLAVFFCGAMIFPAQAFTSFYNNFNKYQGLSGEKWIETNSPEKYGAIIYLRKNSNDKNLVESVGDSYSQQNSISVFSGVPSIQGWRVHEWLWRGGYDVVATRSEDVKTIYEGLDVEKTKLLLQKYNIGWIYVGNDERAQYEVNENKIKSLGSVVWNLGEVYLVKVK